MIGRSKPVPGSKSTAFPAPVLVLILLAIWPAGTAGAATIHVPADQPTIQAGIDPAVDGDTVLVANGLYSGEGNRDIDFLGKAITVRSANGANYCIIDCGAVSEDARYRGFFFRSGEGPIDIEQLDRVVEELLGES